MSEDRTMTVDIIPACESGSFRITDRMLMESGAVSVAAFEILLREEAHRRGLDVTVEYEQSSRDVIVSWRPATERGKP